MDVPEPPLESVEVTRLRTSRWALALPLVGFVPVLALGLASALGLPAAGVGVAGFAGLVAMVLLLARATRLLGLRSVGRGALRVDDRGVHWQGRLIAPRARIGRALVVPETRYGTVVRLAVPLRLTSVELGVRDEAEGRAVLRALGRDAARSTARFVTHPPLGLLGGVLLQVGAMLASTAGLVVALRHLPASPATALEAVALAVVAGLAALLPLAPGYVTVGTDGVLIGRLGRRRFVPWPAIARAHAVPRGVRLVLHEGAAVELPVGPTRHSWQGLREHERAERDALLERLHDAMAASQAPPGVDPAALARGPLAVADWLAALRALATRAEGGMRQAPVLREHLWRCLADPRAVASARAGAAVALAAGADGEARGRIRVAAAACASPRLRVVLEAAADGADERLAEALGHIDDERRGAG